ncbi:MAG TPA: trypsin-like peptidase domain-containing protein [Euzebya sp.]|nr:trypsin-like peptidase domain-containing protein [Euzebya sp.]
MATVLDHRPDHQHDPHQQHPPSDVHGHLRGWDAGRPVPLPVPPPPSRERPAARRERNPWGVAVVSAALAAVVSAGIAVPIARTSADDATADAVAAAEAAVAETATVTDLPIAQIAAEVSPSVARVNVIGPRGQGSGSAVVYGADGILVTNNHVVAGATEVEVTLPDGQSHTAEVVGTDPLTDLAVLRIDVTDLPAITLAGEDPDVGDTTIAIGSPFGLEGSVTSGIVSATNRRLDGQGGVLGDLIQTDASINPGNSGGALVNGQGELIGLNTAILSGSGTSSGVGFAVPVTTVGDVADQILQTGSVVHAALGVAGQTVDPQTAESYNLPVERGAVIAQIQPDSAASLAGLQRGDIVTAIEGELIESIADLSAAIRGHRPGEEITLDIVRQGEETQVGVTLGESTS